MIVSNSVQEKNNETEMSFDPVINIIIQFENTVNNMVG